MIVLVGSGRAQGKREGPKLERQRASFSSTLYYRNSQVIFLIPKTIEKRQLWKWHQPGQGMLSCRCWHTPPIPLFVSTQLCRSKFTGRLLFQICSSTLLLLYSASFFFNLLFVAWCSLNLNFSYDLVNGFIFLSVVSILVLFIN